jgi:hypothetical protein
MKASILRDLYRREGETAWLLFLRESFFFEEQKVIKIRTQGLQAQTKG